MNNEEQNKETLSIQEQLNLQQEALAKIYKSTETTRKIIFWTGIVNLVVFVLPLIVAMFAFPYIIKTFTSSVGGISGGSTTSITEIANPVSLSESLENLKSLGF